MSLHDDKKITLRPRQSVVLYAILTSVHSSGQQEN